MRHPKSVGKGGKAALGCIFPVSRGTGRLSSADLGRFAPGGAAGVDLNSRARDLGRQRGLARAAHFHFGARNLGTLARHHGRLAKSDLRMNTCNEIVFTLCK